VAPSAISRHIGNTEADLSTSLFHRNARGLTLTPAGEVYLRYARSVLLDRERMRTEIDELKGLKRGHIRITSIDGVVSGPLSHAVSSFRGLFPGITFQLTSTGAELVTRAIREGDADVGLAYAAYPDSEVEIVLRIADPLFVIVAPDHPLATLPSVLFRDALRYPLALPEPTFGIRRLIDSFCVNEGLVLSPVLETNSIEALRGFARSGAGVSMLHYLSISREVELGSVAVIPFDDEFFRHSWVDVCVRRGRQLPTAVERFIPHLKRTLGHQVEALEDRVGRLVSPQ
jgi:DNA-binding transcriptional LysR family regulator